MNPLVRNRLIGLAIAVALFAADQAFKGYILRGLGLQLGESHYLLPFFQYTLTHNYGVSLGMFTAASDAQRWALVAVTGLIAVAVTVWLLREKRLGDILPLALVLGGALGNILDRVRMGYVLDYADLHFGAFRPFLIFNVGDACITIGVLIILARSLFMSEKPRETQSDAVDTAPADHTAETH